jgi:hypothetical protein
MDIVYTLGRGSKWNDNELYYSLCSVSRFFKGVGKIFIVGAKPRFTKPSPVPFYHVEMLDAFSDVTTNLRCAFQLMTEVSDIGDKFLWMNDDFFFFSDVDTETFPYYSLGELGEHVQERSKHLDYYYFSLKTTYDYLIQKGLPVKDFEVHMPFIFEKTKLAALLQELPWPPYGYLLRSLYGNTFRVQALPFIDCKIRYPMLYKAIVSRLSNKKFFSLNEESCNHDMRVFLERRYAELGFP